MFWTMVMAAFAGNGVEISISSGVSTFDPETELFVGREVNSWANGMTYEVGGVVFLDPKRMLGVGGSVTLDHVWSDTDARPEFLPIGRALVMFTTPGEGFGFRIEGGIPTLSTALSAAAWTQKEPLGAVVLHTFGSVRGRPQLRYTHERTSFGAGLTLDAGMFTLKGVEHLFQPFAQVGHRF